MKTIKVIDLLNKIANGEHNFSFKYGGDEFFYDFDSKHFIDTRFKEAFGEGYSLDKMLNDEVEIIEEDKKIEKVHECFTSTDNKEIQFVIDNINQLGKVVNKIIDYINKNEEKK